MAVTLSDIVKLVAAVILPPLGVFLVSDLKNLFLVVCNVSGARGFVDDSDQLSGSSLSDGSVLLLSFRLETSGSSDIVIYISRIT